MANFYALPEKNMYPLDTLSDVVKAQGYFLENETSIPVDLRRSYCSNLAKRQNDLGIISHEKVAEYAGELDMNKLKMAIEARMLLLEKDAGSKAELQNLIKDFKDVDDLISRFSSFDKIHMLDRLWDSAIPNPVTGLLSAKEAMELPEVYSSGPDMATGDQIRRLVNHREILHRAFNDEVVDQFLKDPISTMKGMTDLDRGIVLRLAREEAL